MCTVLHSHDLAEITLSVTRVVHMLANIVYVFNYVLRKLVERFMLVHIHINLVSGLLCFHIHIQVGSFIFFRPFFLYELLVLGYHISHHS